MKVEHDAKICSIELKPIKNGDSPKSNIIKEETSNSDQAMRKMIIITIICTFFLLAELVGGIIANSLAILTDAAHLSSDLSGFVISIFAICIGKKKANKKYTFGYYRAEVLGALISVVTIWLMTILLLKEAIDRLFNPVEIYAPVMLFTAVLGLICNLAMMKVLHSGPGHAGCSHGHGNENAHSHFMNNEPEEILDNSDDISTNDKVCLNLGDNSSNKCDGHDHSSHDHSSHDYSTHGHSAQDHSAHDHSAHDHSTHNGCSHNNKDSHDHSTHDLANSHAHHDEENVNIRAAIIHIIGDIIQSVGVVIASLIIYFKPHYVIVDPICTFVFSIIVLFTTFNITKQCLSILMEASPSKFDAEEIQDSLKQKFANIYSIHALNVWSLGSGKNCISLHVVIDNHSLDHESNNLFFLTKIKSFIESTYKFEKITVQVETIEENLKLKCKY